MVQPPGAFSSNRHDTSEAMRDSLEDFCSGGVYPRLFGGADPGGYKTRPYEDDT
jgi:hypothetical protein